MIQTSFLIHTQEGKKCRWCEEAMEVLTKKGLPYMVRALPRAQLIAVAKRSDMDTVPIIYHGLEKIGGYDDLIRYLDTFTEPAPKD